MLLSLGWLVRLFFWAFRLAFLGGFGHFLRVGERAPRRSPRRVPARVRGGGKRHEPREWLH